MSTTLYLLPIEKASEKDESYYARYFPERLERAKGFRHEDDRLRCLAGSLLLREVLGLDEARLSFSANGKPSASGQPFNLSHSGEYAVLAVSDLPVGVDMERCSLRHVRVANSVFTEAELQWMHEDAEARFTLLWTLKEAVSKALGLGLQLKFSEFDVLPLLRDAPISICGETLYGKALTVPGYSLSVCTAGALGEVTIVTL